MSPSSSSQSYAELTTVGRGRVGVRLWAVAAIPVTTIPVTAISITSIAVRRR